MQEQKTGIVRRLDHLGRVVLPKEMRKTLRWKDNDPLEMYTVKDELVIKKYSPAGAILPYAADVAEGIRELMEKPCFIADTDEIVYVTGGKYRELVGKKISDELDKIIRNGKSLLLSKADGGEIVSPVKNEIFTAENEIIVPIYKNGYGYGAVIAIGGEKDSAFKGDDVKIVRLAASVLARSVGE